MGFLDKKERIYDVVLTNRGRELLSKGLLQFEYFAFSDCGVDYSGSLALSGTIPGTLDQIIYKSHNFFEADQRVADFEKKVEYLDLDSFLYNIAEGEEVLPSMVTSVDEAENLTISLERRYKLVDTYEVETIIKNPVPPENIIFYVENIKADRQEEYTRLQTIIRQLSENQRTRE